MNIFMRAAKKKLRFSTCHGKQTVECLWDLTLDDLNALVVRLRDEAKEAEEGGYLDELFEVNVDALTKLRFEVAEAIIIARVAEAKAHDKAAENKIQRERVLAIIASKKAQELEGQDLDALMELAESLK